MSLTLDDIRDRAALNAHEVGQLLGMNAPSVHHAARNNRIPHKRLGRKVVFPVPALLKWLGDDEHANLGAGLRAVDA